MQRYRVIDARGRVVYENVSEERARERVEACDRAPDGSVAPHKIEPMGDSGGDNCYEDAYEILAGFEPESD